MSVLARRLVSTVAATTLQSLVGLTTLLPNDGAGSPHSRFPEFPRNTRIGPTKGLWWKCTTLGEKFYIHRRFHKDINAMDAKAGFAS